MKSFFVDSFTTEPFKGNPAGVCFPEAPLSDDRMLKIAREFGFSETAFVLPLETPGDFSIRYFSPKKEIALCGHATLAAARIIFDQSGFEKIRFVTGKKLELPVRRTGEEIGMEFPVYETRPAPPPPPAMLEALGLPEILNARFSEQNAILMLEISETERLSALKPDFPALTASYSAINGVLVTSAAHDGQFDYHYRYFWPWAGTNEDPVTGGVQTFLAKYWSEKLGKTKMQAFQSSERTGSMRVELSGEKVFIFGRAVVMLKGELQAP